MRPYLDNEHADLASQSHVQAHGTLKLNANSNEINVYPNSSLLTQGGKQLIFDKVFGTSSA